MKILLVTLSCNADHQDTLFGLYEQLVENKNIDVYLLATKEPKVPLAVSEHTWLVDCPMRPGICKKTFDLPLLISIIHKIKKKKFDAIYFESLHVWNIAIMIAMSKRVHIYQVIHEVIPHEGDSQVKGVDLMNRAICRLANVVVLRNQTYVKQMSERYKFPIKHIKYLELWRRYPSYTNPSYSGKVLFFGRMNPYKGVDNLFEIARMCPNIQFEAVGKVDPKMQSVIEHLHELPNVTLKTGYVSDEEMRVAFVGADWILVPYNSASQSGIIIDAYKYSRPVIAFSVGAISEQVEDGKSGFLVHPGDNTAFADSIQQAIAMSKEKYTEMTKYAYHYGSKKYTAGGSVNRFLNLIGSRE